MKGRETVAENNFPIKLDDCTLFAAFDDGTVASEIFGDKNYKLVLVKDGKLKLVCKDKECELAKGQAVLLFPFEQAEFFGIEKSTPEFSVISFTVNGRYYGESFSGVKSGLVDLESRIFADETVNVTVKNICNELKTSDKAFSMQLLSLLCSQLLVYLLRNMSACLKAYDSDDANLRICGQVMSYIDSNIYGMKNLREVAAAVGYNYSYISTLFRKTVGVTLNSYFKTKRMNEARKLLQDNKTSVSEIARIMNYSSVYAFSKAFKEHFGASPGHYSGRFPNKVV